MRNRGASKKGRGETENDSDGPGRDKGGPKSGRTARYKVRRE